MLFLLLMRTVLHTQLNKKKIIFAIFAKTELTQKFQNPRIVPDFLLCREEVLVALGPLPLEPLVHHVEEEALAVQVLGRKAVAVLLNLILQVLDSNQHR
jgi:hypothetical protein